MITSTTTSRPNSTNALLLGLVVAMDACWIYAASRLGYMLLAINLPGIFEVPQPLVLGAFEGTALVISALLLRLEWLPLTAARVLLGVLGFMAIANYLIAAHPPDPSRPFLEWLVKAAYSTIICLAVWILGSVRYSDSVGFNDVYKSFRNGLIAMGLVVLFSSPIFFGARSTDVLEDIGALPVWFFICALAALGIAHREQVREEAGETGSTGGSWNLTVTLSMALVLMVGLVVGAIGGETIVQMVRTAFVAIIIFVGLPFYLAAYVIFALLAMIFQLFNFGNSDARSGTSSSTFVDLLEQLERMREDFLRPGPRPPNVGLPFDLVAIGTWAALVIAIVAIVAAASMGLRRARREKRRQGTQHRESFGSWSLLMTQLRDWLRSLWSRLRRDKSTEGSPTEDGLAALRGRPEWVGTLSIREIYALLQKRAALLGYPRAGHQTPTEYMATLSVALPNVRSDLRTITSAYIQARYGPLPASGPIVVATNDAWQRMEPLLVAPSQEA
jgi:hypothetical protein